MANTYQGLIVSESQVEDNYTCGICSNLLVNPCRPNVCKHAYCRDCLYNSYNHSKTCPMCRKDFDFNKVVFERKLDDTIANSSIKCEYCLQTVKVPKLQNHRLICNESVTPKNSSIASDYGGLRMTFGGRHSSLNNNSYQTPNRNTTPLGMGRTAPMVPNRFTFACPYCNENNLTLETLRGHCNEFHMQEEEKEKICPVCVAMPWGIPNQKSIDFITHLNFRHKFEYGNYVDFELDDDESLALALNESLRIR